MPPLRTILKRVTIGLVALLVLIQLVPYGRAHDDPPGRRIAWDSKRTERLMTGACMDCHSNQTTWPLYSNVAPVSWLVQKDVDEGRDKLNLSTDRPRVREMVEKIRDGSMPPWQYKPLHPASRLSSKEKKELIDGIEATFGPSSGP
jgi:hypothetical protein